MALVAQRVLLLRATDVAGGAGFSNQKSIFFTCYGCDMYVISV
jgi:hypothetical protein